MPPVCPSPRPLIFPNGTPQAATIGPTAIDVLSPTPPVECLSTTLRPSAAPRSSVSPRADHRVGQRERLRGRQPAEVDGHAERGHLVVGHLAARVAERARELLGELVRRRARARSARSPLRGVDQLGGDRDRRPPSQARHGSTIGSAGDAALAGRLAAEPGVHRRADVGELAVLVDPPGGVRARRVGEQQRVLARVVGRRRRRVAAVVGGDDQQVARRAARRGCRAAAGRSPAGSGGS